MQGRFITFEGGEGVGKSTQIRRASAWLEAEGVEVVLTREPGGTPRAEQLRRILLERTDEPMPQSCELLLMFAARASHLANLIEPAVARGAWVLCDRFTDATFAYQGAGRGFDLGVLTQLENWVQQGRQPDLTLWFDLPPPLAAERRAAVRSPDRFEQQDTAFFSRVREGYARRMAQDPHRFVRLDAAAERAAVWVQIQQALEQRPWW